MKKTNELKYTKIEIQLLSKYTHTVNRVCLNKYILLFIENIMNKGKKKSINKNKYKNIYRKIP